MALANAPITLTWNQLHQIDQMPNVGTVYIKTVTRKPKKGHPYRYKLYQWGSYNNIGLHNDGIEAIIKHIQCNPFCKRIIVSIAGKRLNDLLYIIHRLNNLPDLWIEWNNTCPNVEHDINDPIACYQTLRQHSKHPVGIKASLMKWEEIIEWPKDIDFVATMNTIKGFGGKWMQPVALLQVEWWRKHAPKAFIIGCSGVESSKDVQRFIDAGANQVAVGTTLLRQGIIILSKM